MDEESKFDTMLNDQHPGNRIGYRYFEHHPEVYGLVPESLLDAGINADEIIQVENCFKNQNDVVINQLVIQRDSLWIKQK